MPLLYIISAGAAVIPVFVELNRVKPLDILSLHHALPPVSLVIVLAMEPFVWYLIVPLALGLGSSLVSAAAASVSASAASATSTSTSTSILCRTCLGLVLVSLALVHCSRLILLLRLVLPLLWLRLVLLLLRRSVETWGHRYVLALLLLLDCICKILHLHGQLLELGGHVVY